MKKALSGICVCSVLLLTVAFVCADEKTIEEFKTAQECYDAAIQINQKSASLDDQMKYWGRKFGLLERAIKLNPSFTDAYVPYVKTYLAQPMGHEFKDTDELDGLIALLKRGLQFEPLNGDEFYYQIAKVEVKRWGGSKDSLRKAIDFLNQALVKYPKSVLKKEILLSMYSNYEYLGTPETGIIYLNKIVDLNGSEQTDQHAIEYLIHYYDWAEDYSNLLRSSEIYLDRFGNDADWSCYAMYCGTLSCNNLKLHDKAIEVGRKYVSYCKNRKGDITTLKKIYFFMSEAYSAKGNYKFSESFKKMSE